jgi:hypothetical protein
MSPTRSSLINTLREADSSFSQVAANEGWSAEAGQTAAANARPRHDLALAVLSATQKAKLAAFEIKLQLASEAIELGLIHAPGKGEVLCQ